MDQLILNFKKILSKQINSNIYQQAEHIDTVQGIL